MSYPESGPGAPAPHSAGHPAGDPAPYPGPAAYPASAPPTPGATLGIVGLVLAFLAAPIGLILSIVAFVKLRKNGGKTGIALAGIIVGALITIAIILAVVGAIITFTTLFGVCAELGPGVWQQGGVTYTCG